MGSIPLVTSIFDERNILSIILITIIISIVYNIRFTLKNIVITNIMQVNNNNNNEKIVNNFDQVSIIIKFSYNKSF